MRLFICISAVMMIHTGSVKAHQSQDVNEHCSKIDTDYLSDSKKIYHQIEEFQALSLKSGGYPILQDIEKDKIKLLTMVCNSVSKELGFDDIDCSNPLTLPEELKIPTRCESIGPYFIAVQLMNDVIKSAKVTLENPTENVIIGTMQHRKINAAKFKFPDGDAILFNTHLFSFINEVSKMMSSGIIFEEVGDQISINTSVESASDVFKKSDFLKERFSNLLYSYLTEFRRPEWWIPEKNNILLYTRLTNYTEIFVAAHEYGHLHLKHNIILPSFSSIDSDTVCKNWKNEFDADEISLRLTMQLAVNDPFFELYRGVPEFWFLTEAIIEDARTIINKNNDSSEFDSITNQLIDYCNQDVVDSNKDVFDIPSEYPHKSHPPTALRLENILIQKSFLLGDEYTIESDMNWGLILMSLWNEARPSFEKLVLQNR